MKVLSTGSSRGIGLAVANQFLSNGHEVIGFEVVDEQEGNVGTCKEFLEVSNNPIMVVAHGDKEILIPASQQFVTGIDRDNRILHIHAPEGLIDMYLE